jgi:hypothetical protein
MGQEGQAMHITELSETGTEHRFECLKVTDQFSDLNIDGSIILKPLLREKDVNIRT